MSEETKETTITYRGLRRFNAMMGYRGEVL